MNQITDKNSTHIMRALIASPNLEWANELKGFLEHNDMSCEIAEIGKNAQMLMYENKFQYCIIDFALQQHTSFEVLRYVKCNSPSTHVIMYFFQQKDFKALDFNQKKLEDLGIFKCLVAPMSNEKILDALESTNKSESWAKVQHAGVIGPETKVTEMDKNFSRIPITEFHMGNTTIFDLYIRLKKDVYLKFLHKGNFCEKERIEEYIRKDVQYLYFKNSDRATYINFMNKAIEKANKLEKVRVSKKVNLIKTAAEKTLESISLEGFKPQLVQESKRLCANIYETVESNPQLSKWLMQFNNFDAKAYEHNFLVSFFATIISKNLDWSTQRTTEIVVMGALLHDLGKLRLKPIILTKNKEKLSEDELIEFRRHPEYGAEMLQNTSSVSENVRQIVYQHHELVDGRGYPNGLTGIKIYPLAKIVSTADAYVEILTESGLSPFAALEKLVLDREKIRSYDSETFKALINGFMNKEEK